MSRSTSRIQLIIFEETWESGEHFRSGALWNLGDRKVFYFRPGHETYPVFREPLALKIVENATLWLGNTVREGERSSHAPNGDLTPRDSPRSPLKKCSVEKIEASRPESRSRNAGDPGGLRPSSNITEATKSPVERTDSRRSDFFNGLLW